MKCPTCYTKITEELEMFCAHPICPLPLVAHLPKEIKSVYIFGDAKEFKTVYSEGVLFEFMHSLSEDCYCSYWNDNIEYQLWNVAPGTTIGQRVISKRQAMLLKLLCEEAGGWWVWPNKKEEETEQGPKFVKVSLDATVDDLKKLAGREPEK